MNEVAVELGFDWHTINDTVLAYGTALIDDDPHRIGSPTALGLDETLFFRLGSGIARCGQGLSGTHRRLSRLMGHAEVQEAGLQPQPIGDTWRGW